MIPPFSKGGTREDLPYWLALVRFRKFGAVRLAKLASAFPSMREAFLGSKEILEAAGIPSPIVDEFLAIRSHLDPLMEKERLDRSGASAIPITDPGYPPLLKTIHDPPALLFVRGILPDSRRHHLAVVGARKATAYGARVVHQLIPPLATQGTVIVSGLAYGIDAFAHQATIEAGGTTIAVLAGGLDEENVYPTQNRRIAHDILAFGGAIVSEFPLGTHVLKQHFPFRNRIIAGLSHGTLVVEASAKSGSLITAQAALEAGRDVYAVPGPIDSPLSEGPHKLIKFGAVPVTSAQDIVPNAAPIYQKSAPTFSDDRERTIYQLFSSTPIHVDELIFKSRLSPELVSQILTLFEINGLVHHLGGQQWIKAE